MPTSTVHVPAYAMREEPAQQPGARNEPAADQSEELDDRAGLLEMKIASVGSPGASWTRTSRKPASASMRRATCSPHAVPSPAPPWAKDTVRQCRVLIEYKQRGERIADVVSQVARHPRFLHEEDPAAVPGPR